MRLLVLRTYDMLRAEKALSADKDRDADGDGLTDIAEFLAGTDPRVAASPAERLAVHQGGSWEPGSPSDFLSMTLRVDTQPLFRSFRRTLARHGSRNVDRPRTRCGRDAFHRGRRVGTAEAEVFASTGRTASVSPDTRVPLSGVKRQSPTDSGAGVSDSEVSETRVKCSWTTRRPSALVVTTS